MKHNRPAGMRAFTIGWTGQMISMLGTAMSQFAYTIWAFEVTGEATALALVAFFSFTPTILLSPFAGALVDRWNRKWIMILSDLAAGLSSVAILLLYVNDSLEIWHLYVAGAVAGALEAFQFPAYSAAVTTMIPKKHYARASGMRSLAGSATRIIAPMLAAVLLMSISLAGILTIDIITFVFAISTLLVVSVPQPEATESGQEGQRSIWQESAYGFRYILARPSMLGLVLVTLILNLFTLAFVVRDPMILARTGNGEASLASVQTAMGVGGVVGGLLLSTWGGPKRKVPGILSALVLACLLGILPMGIGRGLLVWAPASFLFSLCAPFVEGSLMAFWQVKVSPDVQGRVFASLRLIGTSTKPIIYLLAGPLADQVLEPAMTSEGTWAGAFGWLVGTDPGAGMALMFVFSAIMGMLVALGGYAIPVVRNADDILPDYDEVSAM